MTSRLSPELLATCLADLETGRKTVDECLADHPAEAAELRAILAVAGSLTGPSDVKPRLGFRNHTRAVLIAGMAGDQAVSGGKKIANRRSKLFAGLGGTGKVWPWSLRLSGIAAVVFVLLIGSAGFGAVYAAQDTLPGDPLYPVKTTVEGWQLTFAGSDETKAQTYFGIASNRLNEIERASQKGDAGAINMAAESFSQNLALVDQHLSQAAEAGKDVTATATQIAGNMGQHEKALNRAAEKAPGAARSALAKAAAASRKGYATASALANRPDPDQGDDAEPTAGAMTDDDAKPGGLGNPAQAWTTRVPTNTTFVSTTVNLTMTQAMSDVRALNTDPNVSGDSYNGLVAKLEAAQAALQRGQPRVATQILNGFVNELNAFQRSGHISPENYDALYATYNSLISSLGGSPKDEVSPNKSANRPGHAGSDVEPSETPVEPSSTTITPEPDKKKDSPGQQKKMDSTPTSATPTGMGASNPTNTNQGSKGPTGNGNGKGNGNGAGNGKNK